MERCKPDHAQGNRLAALPLKKRYPAPAAPFARKYTPSDIKLLAEYQDGEETLVGWAREVGRNPCKIAGVLFRVNHWRSAHETYREIDGN